MCKYFRGGVVCCDVANSVMILICYEFIYCVMSIGNKMEVYDVCCFENMSFM